MILSSFVEISNDDEIYKGLFKKYVPGGVNNFVTIYGFALDKSYKCQLCFGEKLILNIFL